MRYGLWSDYDIDGYNQLMLIVHLKFCTISKVADQVKECKEFFSHEALRDAGLMAKELPSGFTSNLACIDGELFTLDDSSKVIF